MIGITTTETWHGDYGTRVKWRAHQISGPKWAVLGGVYLRDTDVKIDTDSCI